MEPTLRSVAVTGLVGLVVLGSARALAAPCPPAATLTGDPTLVAAVGDLLAARGIATDAARCPAAHAEIQRRGAALVVIGGDAAGGEPIERVVNEPTTAASVIESWARTDVAAPLLASRSEIVDVGPTTIVERHAIASPHPRGVQLFSAAETSFASDRTTWVGGQVGACVMFGPVCAAARVRFAAVVAGPGPWGDDLERRGAELLLGGDIPLRIGGATISPGFGAGIGWMHTRASTETMSAGGESGGLRADVHAALSIPIRRHLALDVAVTADLTQATHIETPPGVQLPDEPRTLVRVGVGVRYGGL